MGAPEGTRKRPPEVHLVGAEDGFAGYVTGMEAEGQRQLVEATVLPYPSRYAEGGDGPFEALGFEFGEAVDDLFREAKLPAGWTKEGSSHSMYSFVIDEDGYRRVRVFYKAAFHHRESHMSLLSADRQQTRAQAEAYDRLGEQFPYRNVAGRRWLHDGWREGENYVWTFTGGTSTGTAMRFSTATRKTALAIPATRTLARSAR